MRVFTWRALTVLAANLFRFFEWVLRGNATSGLYFTNGEAEKDGFATAKKSLENIKSAPI